MKQNSKKQRNRKEEKQSNFVKLEIQKLVDSTREVYDSSKMTLFTQLPLSTPTQRGLRDAGYIEMTDIQRFSLGYSLCGRDILGAAKTGSGKSLAFVIPIIESLYRQSWQKIDGLGALIISPTRELALQLFNVLRKVGKYHHFSAGLAIGGKSVEEEKERINSMNILVVTPGRLLQHMDETAYFDCSNLQILVLDEADRILDLGFKKTVNAIIDFIPKQRQTLLFSATQTKSVKDLARLSLKDPEYVSVHEKAQHSTPDALSQNYLVCELYEKLDILYSFIKSHLKSKIIVFMSSCKQVRFAHEVLCKMQPGIVLTCLHGKQKQLKRNTIYTNFCKMKAAVLFCTDIAARGLDFPNVDWVIQMDCPEDVETYVHRAGRTARYNSNGNALLFLLPSEEQQMAKLMELKKIPIKKIQVNPSKTQSIIPQLQSICAENQDIKYLAEKTFVCYLRSIWLQKNKDVFDVTKLPLDDYAASLGLTSAPQVKFVRRIKAMKNVPYEDRDDNNQVGEDEIEKSSQSEGQSDDDSSEDEIKKSVKTKLDRTFAKKYDTANIEKLIAREDDEDEDDILKIVRKDHDLDDIPTTAPQFDEHGPSIRDKRKLLKKNKIKAENADRGVKLVFDDEGNADLAWKLEAEKEFVKDGSDIISKQLKYVETTRKVLQEADVEDKKKHKERLREKRLKKKRKLDPADNTPLAVLSIPSEYELHSDSQSQSDYESEDNFIDQNEEELALQLLQQ